MYKRAYFLCCATYHLAVALYYSMQAEWHNTEKVLVWQNNTNAVVDKKLLEEHFDRVIYVRGKDLITYPFLEQQVYKTIHGGWLFGRSEIGRMLREMPHGNAVFLFNDMVRLTDKVVYEFGKKSGNKIILVDEGTGTYNCPEQKLDFKTKLGNFLCGMKTEPYIGANPYISTVLARDIPSLPEYQTNGRETVRQNLLFFDDSWTEKMISAVKTAIGNYTVGSENKTALWIGEPLSPSLMSEEHEKNTIDRIFKALSGKYVILIKMHPREDISKYADLISKYGASVVRDESLSWFPVEILANVLGPDTILTPLSSAVGGIKQDIKAVYCYKLFGLDLSNRSILDMPKIRSNTYFADTLSELDGILAKEPCAPEERIVSGKNQDKDIAFIQTEIAVR